MATLEDKALVLRKTPFGESSLIVQALTRKYGRVHFMAKGAYRQTSSYYCILDFFDELELTWGARNNRDLVTLRRGRIGKRRGELSSSPERYRVALQILELCELAAQPAQVNTDLFDLVTKALEALRSDSSKPSWVLVVFELRFLQNLGLAPSLRHCASCAREAPALNEQESGPRASHRFFGGCRGTTLLGLRTRSESLWTSSWNSQPRIDRERRGPSRSRPEGRQHPKPRKHLPMRDASLNDSWIITSKFALDLAEARELLATQRDLAL